MDEVKNTKKTQKHHWHINEIQMTCKEHCHTTDTYLQIFYYVALLIVVTCFRDKRQFRLKIANFLTQCIQRPAEWSCLEFYNGVWIKKKLG